MTNKEFKSKILRINWYDKYFYYVLGVYAICTGIYISDLLIVNPIKYKAGDTALPVFVIPISMIIVGCGVFFVVSRRYSASAVESTFSIPEKKVVVNSLQQKLSLDELNQDDTYYYFKSSSGWLKGYNIFINIDTSNFYICVISRSINGRFIDFGETAKRRKQIAHEIWQLSSAAQ